MKLLNLPQCGCVYVAGSMRALPGPRRYLYAVRCFGEAARKVPCERSWPPSWPPGRAYSAVAAHPDRPVTQVPAGPGSGRASAPWPGRHRAIASTPAASTSPRTASSAGRLPWISASTATRADSSQAAVTILAAAAVLAARIRCHRIARMLAWGSAPVTGRSGRRMWFYRPLTRRYAALAEAPVRYRSSCATRQPPVRTRRGTL